MTSTMTYTFLGDGTRDHILEQNDYLPFGTRMPLKTQATNRYRYAGKEEQDIAGMDLGLLDFGARYYDAFTCRWNAIDTLAHKYFGMSPYNYCGNDPVNRFDPDGRIIICGSWSQELINSYMPYINSYFYKVHHQLDILKSLDSRLDDAISNLESSSKVYYIKPEKDRPNGKHGNCYIPKDRRIYYDPYNDNSPMADYGDDKKRPAEAALAHELGHAENDENGTRVSYDADKANKGNKTEQERRNLNERKPVDFENIVRDASGSKHRSYDYLNPFQN